MAMSNVAEVVPGINLYCMNTTVAPQNDFFNKEIPESRYFNIPILDKRVSHIRSEEVETTGHDVNILMWLQDLINPTEDAYRS